MESTDFVMFTCKGCKTEIHASLDMAGVNTECPACGMELIVPTASESTVIRHGADEVDQIMEDAMKRRTIRIQLDDEVL